MRKSIRLYVTGSVQLAFYGKHIKEESDKLGIRGFVRTTDDKRIEIFLEGPIDRVNEMIEICKTGPQHALIRNIEMKDERFQDFKDFKVLRI